MQERDSVKRIKPISGVFCGPDKYLSLERRSVTGRMPPVMENDSYYLRVISGRARLWINGVDFEVGAGHVCWINSYQILELESIGEEPVELESLVYDYQLFCYLTYRYCPLDLKTPALRSSPVLDPCGATEYIGKLFDRFDKIERSDTVSCALMKVSIIGQICLVFNEENRKYTDSFNARELPVCWRASYYIAMHSHEHLSAASVARALRVDAELMNRELLNRLGMDFQQTLNRNRCMLASSYFLCENMSLDCIALQSGFSSVVTFFHVFKQTMGVTPNEYRDSLLHSGKDGGRHMILDDRMFLIMRYLFDNFTSDISLKTISENTYVTPNIIRTLLKNTLGLSFKDILSQYRVRYSEALLTSTDLALADISTMSGFGSQRTFCRVFTAFNGKSPIDYRKKYRRNIGRKR